MNKLLLLLVFLQIVQVKAQDFPEKSNKLVNDYANLLNQEEAATLEHKLDTFARARSTQIAVVILESLGGYPIQDYAVQLGQKWGIGKSGKNNGILLLIAAKDHKLAIETGYGTEGAVPDALARRIIEQDIKPSFKQGQYYQGIEQGTNTLMSLTRGEFTGDDYMKKGKGKFPVFLLFIIGGIIYLVIYSRFTSVRSYARTNSIPFWVAWGLMNAASGSSRGRWSDFSGGSGSFGGGWGGGSSGGGGGFGGFGGGSFGGGGASGSW